MQTLPAKLRFFFIFQVFSSFFASLMTPFWVIYFHDKVGLSFYQISLLIIGNHLATTLVEIPTGAIADLWGRKISVSLSLIIGSFVSIGIYFTNTFLLLLLFYIIAGVGATFKSGAFEAWFTDSLIMLDSKANLTKMWGRLTSCTYLGSMLGFLMGSGLVHFGILREIWLIEGVGTLLMFFLVLLKGEEPYKQSSMNKTTFHEYLEKVKNGSSYLFRKVGLIFVVTGSFFFYFSSGIVSLLWQPFLKDMGISVEWFGPIMVITLVQGIFISQYSYLFTKKQNRELKILLLVSIGCALSLYLMKRNVYSLSLVWYLIYVGIYCLESPIFMSFLNRFIPSEKRATILSTYNLIISGATIICSYLFGLLSTKYGLHAALSLSIISAFLSAIFFTVSMNRVE